MFYNLLEILKDNVRTRKKEIPLYVKFIWLEKLVQNHQQKNLLVDKYARQDLNKLNGMPKRRFWFSKDTTLFLATNVTLK